jgi:hypothetical protein
MAPEAARPGAADRAIGVDAGLDLLGRHLQHHDAAADMVDRLDRQEAVDATAAVPRHLDAAVLDAVHDADGDIHRR